MLIFLSYVGVNLAYKLKWAMNGLFTIRFMVVPHITTFFFIRYLVKMWCIVVFDELDAPSISHTLIHLSSSSNVDTITIEVVE